MSWTASRVGGDPEASELTASPGAGAPRPYDVLARLWTNGRGPLSLRHWLFPSDASRCIVLEADELKCRLQPSDQRCSICLEEYEARALTACGHSFCGACITAFLRANPPHNEAPCPFCRATVTLSSLRLAETGGALLPKNQLPGGVVTSNVDGAWFGDANYIPRVEGSTMDDRQGLSNAVWHVADVCWFECGSSAVVDASGSFDVSFRVKRLPNMTFGTVGLVLNGVAARNARLKCELCQGGWQLLHVGTATLPRGGGAITANMRSAEQSWWKRGLLIDCMVIMREGRRDTFFDYAPVVDDGDGEGERRRAESDRPCCALS